ncbi:hypothetical protein ACQPZZ_04760 [Microbispora sp. CA-135349]|uniref:hypothetical protein n=1 Tax=Microbispora sp. CA-135349 TaxID=3239953 RepID=UPI003D93610E
MGPSSDDRDLIAAVAAEHVEALRLLHDQTEDVAALCERVVVMEGGRALFDGTPAGLAAVATGRVSLGDHRPGPGSLFWRTADGRYRTIGDAPAGAVPADPTVEDGYLLLVGRPGEAA